MLYILPDINNVFHGLISPLTDQERQELEEFFHGSTCVEAVVSRVCSMRLRSQSLTEMQRWYLIGKRYEIEKIIGVSTVLNQSRRMHRKRPPNSAGKPFVRESIQQIEVRLCREYHVSGCTVRRYHTYACALDRLAAMTPWIANEIVLGRLRVPYQNVIQLSRMPKSEVERLSQNLSDFPSELIAYSRAKVEREMRKVSSPTVASPMSIKHMPDYDPDAGFSSLSLTIPSWISSMERTCATADFCRASDRAKKQLEGQLLRLVDTAHRILNVMEETS